MKRRLIGLISAVVGALLLASLGLSSSAGAQSAAIPICQPSNYPSVPASRLATDGQSVICRTLGITCPRAAYECGWSLDGSVRSTGLGRVRREISGTFRVGLSGGGRERTSCPANGGGATGYCSGSLDGKMKPGEIMTGGCSATAGALTDPYSRTLFNAPTHIEITRCQPTVTALLTKPKGCRPPPGSLVNPPGRTASAFAAQNRCTVIRRPVRPVRNPPQLPPPTPTPTPTPTVHVQVDPFPMVFNEGTVQGAGTVTSDPAGISCSVSREFAAIAPTVSGTCAASFPGGTHLTLTATADPQSSVFHGWSDAYGRQATAGDPCYVQGTGPCVLTLGSSGGYEVAASFGLQTRVLTIDNADQEHGEVLASAPTGGQQAICGVEGEQCSIVYPFGQPVTVSAHGENPPILGFGLQGCDASYPDTQPCQVTMTTDKTLVVNWIDQGG